MARSWRASVPDTVRNIGQSIMYFDFEVDGRRVCGRHRPSYVEVETVMYCI